MDRLDFLKWSSSFVHGFDANITYLVLLKGERHLKNGYSGTNAKEFVLTISKEYPHGFFTVDSRDFYKLMDAIEFEDFLGEFDFEYPIGHVSLVDLPKDKS